jgi:hypothetical protein
MGVGREFLHIVMLCGLNQRGFVLTNCYNSPR